MKPLSILESRSQILVSAGVPIIPYSLNEVYSVLWALVLKGERGEWILAIFPVKPIQKSTHTFSCAGRRVGFGMVQFLRPHEFEPKPPNAKS